MVTVDRTHEAENKGLSTGFMSLGKKHHLVPVEAIAEEEPGSITLTVDQQTVQSALALGDPHAAPDEGLQRAAREHCGLAALPPDP
jgi:hypothetical protein